VEEVVREFALMSRLEGTANVVSYKDHTVIQHTGNIGWDIIIRMELLTPLLDYTSDRSFTRMDVIKLGMDICRALELCQKFNIIHRDIKPENIFVSELGDYKLGDFGIARTVEKTMSGLSKKGTYTYMAPEIYRGDAYGSNADIYSLGLVLYRLLNDNRAPFLPKHPAPITHNDREKALAQRISGAELPLPKNADGRLAEIVLKACAYNPKERYSSPKLMYDELDAILYNRADAPIIYPDGDEAPMKSVEYIADDARYARRVTTGSETTHARRVPDATVRGSPALPPPAPEPLEHDKTESVFGGATPASDKTESVFGRITSAHEKTENASGRTTEKTESAFGGTTVKTESAWDSKASLLESEALEVAKKKSKAPLVTLTVSLIVAIVCFCVFMLPEMLAPTWTIESLSSASVGDVIQFGGQDWRVLEATDDKLLILSNRILEYREYHNSFTSITWAESDIRRYLNGVFLDNTFSENEKSQIAETSVENNDNPWFNAYGGANTTDRIFLLSLEEVVRYFGDSGQLNSRPSENAYWIEDRYNTARIARNRNGEALWWWLRSPGGNSNSAAGVGPDGGVGVGGNDVSGSNGGVRPALWLNLES